MNNNKSKLNTIDYKTLANEIFISQLKNIKAYDKPISIFLMGIPASGKLDELLSKISAFFREFSSFNVMKA